MGGVRCLGLFPKKKTIFLDAFPKPILMMLINCNAMVIMQVVMIFNDLSDVLEMV